MTIQNPAAIAMVQAYNTNEEYMMAEEIRHLKHKNNFLKRYAIFTTTIIILWSIAYIIG